MDEQIQQQEVSTPAPVAAPAPVVKRKMTAHKKLKKAHKKAKRNGFSLIELLVVIAIILIIVGIAIPRLLAARTSAVETAAGSTMRTTNTALMAFNSKFGVWPAALTNLGGTGCDTAASTLTAGCFIDNGVATNMATPGVGQYLFSFTTTGNSFTLNADPIATSSAKRHFYSDTNLVVHYNDTAAAAATDPTIGN